MKVVINRCYGGYGLSLKACEYLGVSKEEKELCKRYGRSSEYEEDRSNPKLVECVEKLGREASGRYACLQVVEIPDGIEYEIDDYDGMERIHQTNTTWY